MKDNPSMARRQFLKVSAITATGVSLSGLALAGEVSAYKTRREIAIFTKCLQFMEMGAMGELLAELGFSGSDMPVRPGGQVLPGNVVTDLPKVFKILKNSGVGIPMITTAIIDPEAPETHAILKTSGELGIRHYRMGWMNYDGKKTIMENLDTFRKTFDAFDKLHRKYGIRGEYQNHSGRSLGSTVWDIHHVLKDIDPEFTGIQYDVRHATVEGGNSWPLGMQLVAPWIGSTDIKDFIWEKNDRGQWRPKSVPLGEGMVNFETYFNEFKKLNNTAPISIHYEYDLGGAEHGNKNPTMPLAEIKKWLAKDLAWLKGQLDKNNL
jgi:L-ribulose-5-phosphate 3-epimerase